MHFYRPCPVFISPILIVFAACACAQGPTPAGAPTPPAALDLPTVDPKTLFPRRPKQFARQGLDSRLVSKMEPSVDSQVGVYDFELVGVLSVKEELCLCGR